jgi:MYXO-CTERM domain-containing protein
MPLPGVESTEAHGRSAPGVLAFGLLALGALLLVRRR